MKKKLLIALLFSILSFNKYSYAKNFQSNLPKVILNGKKINSEVSPTIVNNRIFVPIRNLMEEIGGKLEWDANENKVTVYYEGKKVVLKLNENSILVDGDKKYIEQCPFIESGRTLVPLRDISKYLNMNIEWVDGLKTALVTEGEYYNTLPKNIVMGFTVAYYDNDDLSYNSVKNTKLLNMVSVFSYSFSQNSDIKQVDKQQNSTLEYAKNNNIIPLAVIHNINNGNFDKQVLHIILNNSEKRAKLIKNIVNLLIEEEYMGVNIDFENIAKEDKDAYSNFIKELKDELTKYGYLTIISIPAKTSDRYTSSWNYAFDYEKLGSIADYIMIMTYDEHYKSSNAGSIASIEWVKSVLNYAGDKIPTEKIILGLALYGYDWVDNLGQAIPVKKVLKLANEKGVVPQWDNESKTPYFSYMSQNKYHEVWYEDENSLKIKLELVKEYNLGGIAFWRLGLEELGFLDKLLR